MKTSNASDGTVCTIPTAASTPRPSPGRRQARIPRGTAARIAAASETLTRTRCSPVRRGIDRQRLVFSSATA